MAEVSRLNILLASAREKVTGEKNLGNPNSVLNLMPWNESVSKSKDFERIVRIPRRVWSEEEAKALSEELTYLLQKEGGTQTLRSVQAISLHDLGAQRGLICSVRVGGGKTLVILLSTYILEALRPLIVVPANLKDKTLRDLKIYRQHWQITEHIQIKSYEWLSRKENADFLIKYRPDSLMFDEAHHLKNTRAAVTKRTRRYLSDVRPNTPVGLFSGTFTNRSLKEMWHLLRMTLPPENCPLPHRYDELDMWSRALDEKVGAMNRVDPGVLLQFCNEKEREENRYDLMKAARQGFRRRLVETPGVVATSDTFEGASLQIAPVRFVPPPVVMKALKHMREAFETPDGWAFSDGVELARHIREVTLGFYYIWDPRPPDDWMDARREWCAVSRKVVAHNNRDIDTEAQVKEAIENGHYPKHEEVLETWEEIKDTFEPNRVAVWLDDFAVDQAIAWTKKHAGIVWVSHGAFGERLAKKSGLPYYRNKGYDKEGNFIEDHPRGQPLIASFRANMEGKNLQYRWNKSLIVHPPTSGNWWEQCIGRTHREGQPEDTVFIDVFFVVLEHLTAFYRAQGDAHFVEGITGQPQKILYADNLLPTFEDLECEDNRTLWEQGALA